MAHLEKLDLIVAYRAAQTQLSTPDVTLTLGKYEWKIHSQVLVSKSTFFKKALEGSFQEATSKKIDLHDDEPWAIARFIQFLYNDDYKSKQVDESDWTCRHCCSHCQCQILDHRGVMQHAETVGSYAKDLEKDQARSDREIHLMMFNFADKYLVEPLINHLAPFILATFFGCPQFELRGWITEPEMVKFVDGVFEEMPYQRLAKYKSFKDEFCRLFCKHRGLMKHPEIQKWFLNDPAFALQIINASAAWSRNGWD